MESNQLVNYQRPLRRPFIFLSFIIIILVTAGCTGRQALNASFPGLSVDGDTVYVAYGPKVLAYDVAEQREIWSYPEQPNNALSFFAPPSVSNGRVVFGDYGRTGGFFNPSPIISIYAFNVDGSNLDELWIDAETASDRIVAKPLQEGDVVYVGTADSLLVAFDVETGDELWRFEAENSIWAQPTLSDDGMLYVASLDRHLYALDAESGDVIWKTFLTGALSGKPIIADGLVLVSNFDNKLHALDRSTGDEVWTAEAGDWIWSAPAVNGDGVYFGDRAGAIFAVELETGTQIWTAQTTGAILTSPVVSDGVVYVTSEGDPETGRGVIVALSAEDGAEVWEMETEAPIFTTPVVVDDDLVVVVNGETELLIGYNLETGQKAWSYFPDA